jgi:hypothetical protein
VAHLKCKIIRNFQSSWQFIALWIDTTF